MTQYNLKNIWLRLINVRHDESRIVGYFFFHHFFLGLGLSLFFTVSGTFFLSLFSVDHFPVVFMLSAVVMMIAGRIYSYFEHGMKIEKLLPWVVLFLIVLTVLFRLGFGISQFILLPILLMVGYRIVYLLINLEFWGLSALVFDVRQGKRLFGLISSGDVPAKLLGYASIYTLVPYINLENLLIVGAVSFLVSYYFLTQILKNTEITVSHSHSQTFSDKNVLQTYFGNNFIISIAVLGFLIVSTFTLIEFVFLSSVQSQYSTEKELASFLSIFFSVGYFFTLLFKTILSGRFSDKVGLKKSLLILPFILLSFSVVFIFYGSVDSTQLNNLIFIGIMTMVMGVVKYSVNDPVFLVLFQPLPPYLRLKGHSVIKGFVQPLALGLIGFILWLIIEFRGAGNFYYLNFGLIVLLILWIISIGYTNKNYLKTLSDAIRKRFISGANIAVRDKGYFDLILGKIKSENIQEVIYSISVLSFSNPTLLKKELPELLLRKNELILEYCINAIQVHKWSEFTDELHAIYVNHKSDKIKAAAVNAYAQLTADASILLKDIKSQEFLVQKSIVTGLIAGENSDARIEAQKVLEDFINSDKRREKIEACTIIGEIGNEKYADSILGFLNEQDEGIVRAAIIAAGKINNDKLISELIKLLHTSRWKNDIIYSLSGFSNVVNIIEDINSKESDLSTENVLDFIKILDRVKTLDSMNLIVQYLNHTNSEVRVKALKSLSGFPLKLTKNHSDLFAESVNDEFHLACKLISAKEGEDLTSDLLNAIDFEIDKIVKRIFTLLGLYHDKELLRKAEAALHISNRESKANALEILDHLIPKKVHQCLTVLVDEIADHDKLHHLKSFKKHDGMPILNFILKHAHTYFSKYTIAIALQDLIVSESNIELIINHIKDKNLLIQQSALFKFKKFQLIHPEIANLLLIKFNLNIDMGNKIHTTNRLSELEKIIVLKSTALFSDTPENIIAELGSIVDEVVVSKDEMIFKKGDPGSSMYIIYNGEIRIHEEDKTFAILKSLDFFGELALLDPEPRSASATALSDTLLLKINQEAAYELMEDRTEVLKSMMTILCRRIRAQNEKLTAEIDSHNS